MVEVSNKTLAALLAGLIVISLISLFFSVTKLSSPGVTGYASSTGIGITNVTVLSTTYINITDNFIDLGQLYPGEVNDSVDANDYFTIRNDGSVDVNISVYDNSTGLFTGTGCSSLPNSCYQIRGNNTQSGTVMNTYTNVPASAGTQLAVCYDLSYTDSVDECIVGVKATVPADEPAGQKTSTVTIVAEQA